MLSHLTKTVYGVVEHAGTENETLVSDQYASFARADRFMRLNYDQGEIDYLKVVILSDPNTGIRP